MKKVTLKKMLLLMGVLAISVTMTSCGDDNGGEEPKPSTTYPYLIETTVLNTDGGSGSSYLQVISKLSGSVDNSNAIQLPFASSMSIYGNDVFVFPSIEGGDGESEIRKYTYDPSSSVLSGPETLEVPANSFPYNAMKVSDTKVYSPMMGLSKVLIFNPKTMTKTGEIDLSTYAHTDTNCEPAHGIIRNGYYYLPLDQIGSSYMPYADYLQADVAIINIETDEVVKVISETTSGLSFPTRPFLKNMIFTDESNDIYIACAGYFGYNPAHLNNGFVCIPSGKMEFDTSKSWDISGTTIVGTSYKPASIFNCKYIGNGKLVADVVIAELATDNPYTSKNIMSVLVDMNAKTIEKIDGLPVSGAHSVFIEKYDDLVYVSVYGDSEVGFYSYNPSTKAVAKVLGTTGVPYYLHKF